jgi:hypothetical protein
MLSDKDLHGVYDVGAQNDHMTGLKAVWNKAIEWERARVASMASTPPVLVSPLVPPLPGLPVSAVPKNPGWV